MELSGLGLDPPSRERIAAEVREVFHLAAVYDLEVGEARADRVNRRGTENVLDLASACPELRRFHHMSTCYVSGRRRGTVRESELDVGQSFHNPYERSKMEAERAVRRRMDRGLPATIYRPSIVVGDHDTGYTQKYDGPYHVVRWILGRRRWAPVPVPPGSEGATVNVVPRDFVTRAVVRLSRDPAAVGETVHLADPEPPGVREFARRIADAAGRTMLPVPVPPRLLEAALRRVPGLRTRVGIPPALVDYFDHAADYDTSNARRLLGEAGIAPPRFGGYVERIVAFVREHPDPPASPLT